VSPRTGDARCSVFDVGDSEDRAFWTAFLRGLKSRGLRGVRLVISDAHTALKAAIDAVLLGAARQRCRVHFLRNVLAQIPTGNAEMVAAAIRTIFANRKTAGCGSEEEAAADARDSRSLPSWCARPGNEDCR